MSDTAFATYCAAKSKASETEGALRLAELEVKGAEQRLDLEFNLAEVEKKAAAERAARQRERQAKAEAKAEAAAAYGAGGRRSPTGVISCSLRCLASWAPLVSHVTPLAHVCSAL